MKKHLIILTTLLLLFAVSFGQTNVKGGIYSNATWTKANSPYIVTDTVAVFPNITLTIQPGVVVKFAPNQSLDIMQGRIIAIGTPTDTITFTSNSPSPVQGSWGGIYLYNSLSSQFDYCNFSYADKGINDVSTYDTITIKNSNFNNNYSGLYSTNYIAPCIVDSSSFSQNGYGINFFEELDISHSSITNNQYGIYLVNNSSIKYCNISNNNQYGVSIYSNDSLINCDIENNGTGLICGSGTPVSLVQGNIIDSNNIGIEINWYFVAITCNRLCNNSTYNVKGSTNSSYSGNVANNYWCTSDSATIANSIYDGYDNINYAIVPFMPIDNGQCYLTTSVHDLSFFNSNLIKIYPNPFSTIATLQANKALKNALFTIYNSYGQKVKQIDNISGRTNTIELYNLPVGLYFMQILQDSQTLSVNKFIITGN